MLKIKILIIVLVSLMISANLYAETSHRYECSQNANNVKDLIFLSTNNLSGDIKYYSIENDSILINGLKIDLISYLFWKDKYFSFIIYVNEKNNIFSIKKYLYDKYKYVVKNSKETTVWQTDDEIILFKKLSLHQAKVLYLCKDKYIEINSLINEIN